MVCTDFNCITNNKEKRGEDPFVLNNSIINFNNLLNSQGLMDLGHDGSPFSWTNKQKGNRKILCRLDRALANSTLCHHGQPPKCSHKACYR